MVKRLWGRACGDVHKCQGVSPLPLLSLIKCQRERVPMLNLLKELDLFIQKN